MEGIKLKKPIGHRDIKVDIQINRFFNELVYNGKFYKPQSTSIQIRNNENQLITDSVNHSTFTDERKFPKRIVYIGIISTFILIILIIFASNYQSRDNTNRALLEISSFTSRPSETVTSQGIVLFTPQLSSTATKTLLTSAITPTPLFTECVVWSEIALDDIGNDMCVFGDVNFTYCESVACYIKFSQEVGDFYLLSYAADETELSPPNCIEITGIIEKIGSSPVMLFVYDDELKECSE